MHFSSGNIVKILAILTISFCIVASRSGKPAQKKRRELDTVDKEASAKSDESTFEEPKSEKPVKIARGKSESSESAESVEGIERVTKGYEPDRNDRTSDAHQDNRDDDDDNAPADDNDDVI